MNDQELNDWYTEAVGGLPWSMGEELLARRLAKCIERLREIKEDIYEHHNKHRIQNCEADRELWLKHGAVSNYGVAIVKNRQDELDKPAL